jgi:AraC-like DNA-binding protein|tara:strand:- start:2679 stop:2882 length:204 start_codon:yes stop_codon:yes gene_type:complete
MSNETSTELVKRVEDFIHTQEQVSIQDVAKQFNMSRYRTNGLLGMLVGAGKIGVKQIGPVKVHYWRR